MDKKNKMILFPVILVVAAIGLFSAMSFNVDDLSNESKTATYIPSDITKANPNIIISPGGSTFAPMTTAQLTQQIVYTLEGTVLSIDDPVLFVSSIGFVKAAIPVTMSVDKIHKGNLNSDTFTFYLNVWGVFIDDYLATSYSQLDKDTPSTLPSYIKDFTLSEIINSQNKKYSLGIHSSQHEIGDKIIVHIAEDEFQTSAINTASTIMITDFDLTPFYSLPSGERNVYKIQDDVIFNYQGIAQQYSVVINESQENP